MTAFDLHGLSSAAGDQICVQQIDRWHWISGPRITA